MTHGERVIIEIKGYGLRQAVESREILRPSDGAADHPAGAVLRALFAERIHSRKNHRRRQSEYDQYNKKLNERETGFRPAASAVQDSQLPMSSGVPSRPSGPTDHKS